MNGRILGLLLFAPPLVNWHTAKTFLATSQYILGDYKLVIVA